MLAELCRGLGLEAEEAALWEAGLKLEADLPQAHERLLGLAVHRSDWGKVESVAVQSLGVNPMSLSVLLEHLWKARGALGHNSEAADACRHALAIDHERVPRWHARLGLLLESARPLDAREHLMEALEANSRDLAALEALARIVAARNKEDKKP